MPADVSETISQEDLLKQFQDRLTAIAEENRQLQKKINDNQATALKLQGAIETLEYLAPPSETEEETTEE